jgi:tetratricopeptide (TPR) repeat protein
MKKTILLFLTLCFYTVASSQQTDSDGSGSDNLLKELAANACKCIDSIEVYDKSRSEVVSEVSACIDEQVGMYQMGSKLLNSLKEVSKDGKRNISIDANFDKNSQEYKDYYYEMERYLMSNCALLKRKVGAEDKQSEKSSSDNPKAVDFYNKGTEASEKQQYKKAADYFEKALKLDEKYAFAWDNLGLAYRKLGEYDKAIHAYEKSLALDPTGLMPLQNLPVVYQYKKEYDKAIVAYERLAAINKNNAEAYYGIGLIYTAHLHDYEKGLDNMCKAYNLYIDQKSPYRTDAEKIINSIYTEMKKQNKEDKFKEILKSNNISFE